MSFLGLGLTRPQWDADFNAFDYGGTTLRRQQNLPWMEYSPGVAVLRSQWLPSELIMRWTVVPDNEMENSPGFDRWARCYKWGFRPPSRWSSLDGTPLEAPPAPFYICASATTCPPPPECPACQAPVPCPPQQSCPTCPPAPSCPTCPQAIPTTAGSKYGVNLGLLVAGVLTAGTGYYGYKKGWFGKKH